MCRGELVPPQGTCAAAPSLALAVFLAYMFLPLERSLRRKISAMVAGPFLALIVAAAILGLALLLYGNLVDLEAELPRLIERGRALIVRLHTGPRPFARLGARPAPDGACPRRTPSRS